MRSAKPSFSPQLARMRLQCYETSKDKDSGDMNTHELGLRDTSWKRMAQVNKWHGRSVFEIVPKCPQQSTTSTGEEKVRGSVARSEFEVTYSRLA